MTANETEKVLRWQVAVLREALNEVTDAVCEFDIPRQRCITHRSGRLPCAHAEARAVLATIPDPKEPR